MNRAELVRLGHHEAASHLEERFAGYVKLTKDGGPLAASYDHDRHIFGGRFPAQTVEEISGASYEGQTMRSNLPGTMPFAVRFYDVALKGRLTDQGFQHGERATDGRGQAKATTRAIFELWHEALKKDTDLGAQRVVVTTTELGDADALGNPLIDETGTNMLFVFRANLLVTF